MRSMVLALMAAGAACVADPGHELEDALLEEGPNDDFHPAYAVAVQSLVWTQSVDERGRIVDGPFETSFATRGALFLTPPFDRRSSEIRASFRLCRMDVPNAGQSLTLLEDPYAHLPDFPLRMRPDGTGNWDVEPWAAVIGANLSDPVHDALQFSANDARIVSVADDRPGVTVSFRVTDWLGFDHTVVLDAAVRAVFEGGRLAATWTGGLWGQFGSVTHSAWVFDATVTHAPDPSAQSANEQLQREQARWQVARQIHTVAGVPKEFHPEDPDVCRQVLSDR